MAILKTSADTNAGQSRTLTHCIKNLHRLYTIYPSNSSILSKHVFIAVSDFGARKKKNLKPDTSGSIFSTPPRQGQIPHPREGLIRQIPHSPGTENSQMPGVCPGGGGGGDVEVSI